MMEKKCDWCGLLGSPAYHHNCQKAFKAGQASALAKLKAFAARMFILSATSPMNSQEKYAYQEIIEYIETLESEKK